MKTEHKIQFIFALVLVLIGAGSVHAALHRDFPGPSQALLVYPKPLIVPVAGVKSASLVDSWGAKRTGHKHEGIDIMVPIGTPVEAAAPGRIAKFYQSKLGGTTIYQTNTDGTLVFYYAHLMRRAPGLKEGDAVEQGQLIGYVGQSGNASTPHLHFEIHRAGDARQWWRGQAFNPYPSLRAGRIDASPPVVTSLAAPAR
jgi:peptidoglycan LD-endopeptidase LytH